MHHIDTLLRLTRERIPWALARFNDGEMSAIVNRKGEISRGAQIVTSKLADALESALKYRRRNYWIGLPCGKCFRKHRQEAAKRCNPKWYPQTTHAVVLTNRNHKRWQEEFPDALGDRTVQWVGSTDQCLIGLPFKASMFAALSPSNAYEYWVDHAGPPEDWMECVDKGAVVMTSCGPLGRVLAHRWFNARPDLTIIDVGSIYDPITLGRKTARIHKGTLPICGECH